MQRKIYPENAKSVAKIGVDGPHANPEGIGEGFLPSVEMTKSVLRVNA
jgi:hypothetical protein